MEVVEFFCPCEKGQMYADCGGLVDPSGSMWLEETLCYHLATPVDVRQEASESRSESDGVLFLNNTYCKL